MNCTKCNSEVPNGAKFCPVCGNACGTASDVKPAAAPPEPEKKNFCGKCGLELRQGAKFCAVCGAPAAGVGDIRPNQNDGATFQWDIWMIPCCAVIRLDLCLMLHFSILA